MSEDVQAACTLSGVASRCCFDAEDKEGNIRVDFSGNFQFSLFAQEAASVLESEMVPDLPSSNKLISQGFLHVGRRHDIPGSATKHLITPGTGPSTSFTFVSASLAQAPRVNAKRTRRHMHT